MISLKDDSRRLFSFRNSRTSFTHYSGELKFRNTKLQTIGFGRLASLVGDKDRRPLVTESFAK